MNIVHCAFWVSIALGNCPVESFVQSAVAPLDKPVAVTEVSSEVSIDGPSGNTLAGTFLLPIGASPTDRIPAVVFITGSGLQDRDETIFGHKPFRLIATELAKAGVASIRCDDRGFGKSTGDPAVATTFDFVDDAKAQIAWLRTRPEIDPARIGVVGHSEGALIGVLLSQAPSPAMNFAVLLAPPGISGAEILVGQSADIYAKMNVEPALMAFALEKHRELMDAVIAKADDAALAGAMRALVAAQFDCVMKVKPSDATVQMAVKQGLAQVSSPWMRTFIALDPAPAIHRIDVPLLILFGERDVQVAPARNLPSFQAGALECPTKPEIVVIPKVNHLFQPAITGMPDEYATIKVEMDQEVLKKIVDWVVATTTAQQKSQRTGSVVSPKSSP